MQEDWVTVSDPGSGCKLMGLLKEGWERHPSLNTLGTESVRVIPIIKFESEEEKEKYLFVEPPETGRLLDMDMNLLTVPIVSYEEEKAGAENQYKILAQIGYREVHKTSAKAVMHLKTPGMRLESWLIHQGKQQVSLEAVLHNFKAIWGFTLDTEELRPWFEAAGYTIPELEQIA